VTPLDHSTPGHSTPGHSTSQPPATFLVRARELDAQDPLARFRERFLPAEGVIAYLDGNSLGRPLAATAERMQSFIADEWGGRLIRG